MIYKDYGKTGKKVSAIGMGGMRFKKEDYVNGFEKAVEIVRYANQLGINYFDTAPMYCDDKSEEIFGEAFKNMPNDFYVSTKTMVNMEPTADDVIRRAEKSLKRLGRNKIDFYHMWCILNLDQYKRVMAKGGPYEGALKLKEEGLIEHLVFSTHANGEEIEYMVNEGGFEGVLLGYNATNFSYRQRGIKAAYEKGLGVVTMNPLGGGIIPQNPDYYQFLQEGNDSLAVSALKFNASHKEISVTLAGISSKEEVRENIKAAENLYDMTDEKLERISKYLNEQLNVLCTGCGYCKGCPKDIPIPQYMDAYNMLLLGKEENEVISRLKWHWGLDCQLAAECIKCGLCEIKCTQHIPIIKRLEELVKIEGKLKKQ